MFQIIWPLYCNLVNIKQQVSAKITLSNLKSANFIRAIESITGQFFESLNTNSLEMAYSFKNFKHFKE